MIHGHLDPTIDHRIRGWAWDPAKPYSRAEIAIFIDSRLYQRVCADLHREELGGAGIGDGSHAFWAELPPDVFDGQAHTITTEPPLQGSPLVFEAVLDGVMESVREGVAEGWLRDRAHPSARRLPVRIHADGVCIARGFTDATSDRFRIAIPQGLDTASVAKWRLWSDPPWRDRSAVVDVVVPVYANVEETLKTLEHAALAVPDGWPFELIVIDDNPADAAMGQALESQQARLGYTLLRNERNLGFVRTVNRGMALHPDRDVILLNSDTRVPGNDWVGRLHRAVYDQAHNGTATPFSNNATICSYPQFCRANPPVGYDDLCREQLRGQTAEIPTAVGFCMYIRRDCLTETGPFDAYTFGRGYGEENDFCMRARRLGWRHVLAADVFVEHTGHVSFGVEGQGYSHENAAKLRTLHPEYDALVDAFIAQDPLWKLRRTIDLARLPSVAEAGGDRVCVATNTLPGGNERYVQELLGRYENALLLRYRSGRHVELDSGPHDRFDLDCERDLLAETLRRRGVGRLHINQIVDAPLGLFELGIPYEVTVHDYAWLCPQVTLQDETGEYCGEPAIAHCESCYAKLGPHKDWGSLLQRSGSVEELREQNGKALRGAELVTFPSRDIRTRLHRYFDVRRSMECAHDQVRPPAARRERREASGTVRVAYIGSLGYAKGFRVLYGLALDALKRGLPLEFVVIGSVADRGPLEELGVKVLGYYQGDGEALEWIEEVDPDVALFPGVLPESYSYTLSIAFAAGLYPVAFDLGAIAERIRETGFGRLLAVGSTAREINEVLLSSAAPGLRG
jgi:GT2 family glycosyltransferase/glycosyltransferase involved in cell wall biosynthesis